MGDAQDELLLDHDIVRVAAEGVFAAKSRAVVGAGEAVFAILLLALGAGFAVLAAVDHAADTGQIAHLELADIGAHGGHSANDFMARYRRVQGVFPFVAYGVQVRVADAAIEDVDLHIIGPGGATFEREGFEGILGVTSGVAVSLGHFVHLFVQTVESS
mgnify:CR=1 FL=1